MSRFRKLSQTIWSCQYHIVWVPKYRFRILVGEVAREAEVSIRTISEQNKCEVVELNVQPDHVHLLVMIPPKVSVSDYVGQSKREDSDTDFEQSQRIEAKTLLGAIISGPKAPVWIRLAWTPRRSGSM